MDMIEITNDAIRSELERALELRGVDYVYPKGETGLCNYVRDAEPSCLVGVVLHSVGVPLERLSAADRDYFGSGTLAGELLRDLVGEGVIGITERGIRALETAQLKQDTDEPWGVAVDAALFQLPE